VGMPPPSTVLPLGAPHLAPVLSMSHPQIFCGARPIGGESWYSGNTEASWRDWSGLILNVDQWTLTLPKEVT